MSTIRTNNIKSLNDVNREVESLVDNSILNVTLDERDIILNERGFVQSVDSVSTLRTSTFPASLERLWLSGYYGVGTAGGGPLYRDSGDTTTADNGGTVLVDLNGVRWKRPIGNATSITEWGGGTETADNAAAINAADEWASSLGGGDILLPSGTLPFTSEIYLSSYNRLSGSGSGSILQGDNVSVNVSGIAAGEHVTHWRISEVYFERVGTTPGPAVLLDGDGTTSENKGQIRFDISNLRIKGSTGNGLVMRNTYIGNIYNPIIQGCAGTGFVVELDTVASTVGANAINIFGGEFQSNNIGAEIGSCSGIFFYGTTIEGNSAGGLDLQGNVRQFAHIGGYYEDNGNWDVRIGSSATSGFSHSFRDLVFFDGATSAKVNSIIGIRSLNCTIDTCGFIGYSGSPISYQPLSGGSFRGEARNCYTDSATLIDEENVFFGRKLDERILTASDTWDAPSVASGSSASTTVSVPGAVPGDFCLAATASSLQDMSLTAYCASNDVVTILLQNNTGSARDLANTTYRITVVPRGFLF